MSKNLKLKKVIKSFVLEPISCISRFPMYISRIHILVVFLDLNATYDLFGTGGQGMPIMAWLRVWVHEIREIAKKHRNQFRTACSGDGRRERKRKRINRKRKKNSTPKTRKKMQRPKQKKKEKKNSTPKTRKKKKYGTPRARKRRKRTFDITP